MARPKLAHCLDRAPLKAVRVRRSHLSVCCKPALRLRQGTRNNGFDWLRPPRLISPDDAFRHLQDLNVYQCLGPGARSWTISALPFARFLEAPRPAARRGNNRSPINPPRAPRFLTISQLFGPSTRPQTHEKLELGPALPPHRHIIGFYQCYGSPGGPNQPGGPAPMNENRSEPILLYTLLHSNILFAPGRSGNCDSAGTETFQYYASLTEDSENRGRSYYLRMLISEGGLHAVV